jgi:lysophospholipase L1-like esterase
MWAIPIVLLAASPPRILIAGDSWGTDIAGATDLGKGQFIRTLRTVHNCSFKATNIAIPGSTAGQWETGDDLTALKVAAKLNDYVWITLMGNDAQALAPPCAAFGRSADQCGDQLYSTMMKRMGTILDAVHAANKKIRVMGCGYDIMFGGAGCTLAAKKVFPQCWKLADSAVTEGLSQPEANGLAIKCFNTQFVKLQKVWEDLASTRPWVDTINILGTAQAAGNYAGVTVGHPDLSKFAPNKYFPDTLGCIHPSLFPVNSSGAELVMEQFYSQYFSKQLGC